jgi:uncharacterized damage-inducible protein DinB
VKLAAPLFALLLAAPAAAQQAAAPPADPAVAAARTLWRQVSVYLVRSAEDMPEADYAFRPTPQVRTFGELIAHVAGAQHMICAAALGEGSGAEITATSKAALVAALKASNDYCERAYAMSDAASLGTATLFGGSVSRLYALNVNAYHDNEHYGNLVTYMRIKGMVPPSSRPAT